MHLQVPKVAYKAPEVGQGMGQIPSHSLGRDQSCPQPPQLPASTTGGCNNFLLFKTPTVNFVIQ